MKIKLGVIFGGESVEHEVSIISAVQAMEQMDDTKYDIIPIYISKERIWYTGSMLKDIDVYQNFNDLKKYAKEVVLTRKNDKFYLQKTKGIFRKDITELDIVFPIVHGNNVEDGSLQGYLESVKIPYVGSHVLGAALGQDKVLMKQVFESNGIEVVPYTWFYDYEYLNDKDSKIKDIKKLGYPVVVKPATLGSSVGITYVKDESKLNEAIEEAIKYDTKIVVEKAVENLVEVNCSVLGNYKHQDTSVIEEVMSDNELLTYADKYIGGSKGKLKGKGTPSKGMVSTDRIIPARIDSALEKEVIDISKKAFRALNLSGLCRIDFLIDKKSKKVYINEPNTIPGSLAFYLWEPIGKGYKTLLNDMINIAIKDYKEKAKKVYSFNTNILSNFNGLKGSKGKLKR